MIIIGGSAVQAQTIIDEWDTVKAPEAPVLKPVTLNAKTMALLLLDFNRQVCNSDRRPRCIASIPKMAHLLALAREKGVSVVYSITSGAKPDDIARELAPLPGEPVVQSGPDKFLGTPLDKILKNKGVRILLVTGTTAQGAVLYTASAAAFRGYRVIVPVDGMSAENLYAEKVTAWLLVNAPRLSAAGTLTKIDLIR